MKKVYFENLDGLRFFAFLAIFLLHGVFTNNPIVEEHAVFKFMHLLVAPGELGVPFFFCLSGFLITYLLLLEKEQHSKIYIGKFYLRRILRIWPLYFAVVLFGFVLFPTIRSFISDQAYLETANPYMYLLFLSNFDQINNGNPYGAGLGVTWSLAVEEQFYLFWPLILTLVKQQYYRFLFPFLFLLSTILLNFFDLNYLHTLGGMSDLSMGATIALIAFNKGKIFEKLASISKPIILLAYILGFVYIYLWAVFDIGNRIPISIFMAFVIFDQCFCHNSFYKMGKFKKISYLGTLTYGLYLLHTISNFIIYNLLKVLGLADSLQQLFLLPVLSIILTLILAYVSYNYFEKPFLKLKSKFALIKTR